MGNVRTKPTNLTLSAETKEKARRLMEVMPAKTMTALVENVIFAEYERRFPANLEVDVEVPPAKLAAVKKRLAAASAARPEKSK